MEINKTYPVDTAWFDEQIRIAKTSLRAIARRGGFDASNLSRVIRGKTPLNIPFAIILADTFNVPIEEIVKRCGIPPPPLKGDKTLKTITAAIVSRDKITKLRERQIPVIQPDAPFPTTGTPPQSFYGKRGTVEEMQQLARSWGGKFLSKTYLKNPAKLTWQCKEGHQWDATANNIKRGSWCPTCALNAKGNIEDMHALAAKNGGLCLSKTYLNNTLNLTWQCKKGHQWDATPLQIKRKHWCPTCSNKGKITIDHMHQLAAAHGGKCLSSTYVNTNSRLIWQCKEGHQWETKAYSILQGYWCRTCSGKTKKTIEQMEELAAARGGKCLSSTYVNSDSKLIWQCKEGHQWEALPNVIRRGSWCPHCARARR